MKVAITGATSGLGLFLANTLTEQGHQVWGASRRPFHPTSRWRYTQCDVSNWESVVMWAIEVQREWGTIDALICAAGTQGVIGPAETCDARKWARTVETNLVGTYYPIRALWTCLEQGTRRRKILCFSGGGASGPRPGFSAYAVAKTAVVRLVETLQAEWKSRGIDINAIAPGALPTAMTDEVLALGPERVGASEFAAAEKTKAQGQQGFAKLAAMVEFLLSERSDGLGGRFLSAPWDDIEKLASNLDQIMQSDAATLRRREP